MHAHCTNALRGLPVLFDYIALLFHNNLIVSGNVDKILNLLALKKSLSEYRKAWQTIEVGYPRVFVQTFHGRRWMATFCKRSHNHSIED